MKTKVFSLNDINAEANINAFLVEHENEIESNGSYFFQDRVIFAYDDGSLEDKIKRTIIRNLKEKVLNEAVNLQTLTQRADEARRGSQTGTIKPDDAMAYENQKNVSEVKLEYLKEQLANA